MPLRDIGNGLKMAGFDPADSTSIIDQYTKQLGLVRLAGEIRQQPLDYQTKQLGLQELQQKIEAAPWDLLLKQQQARVNSNTIDNLWVQNIKQRAEARKAQIDAESAFREQYQNRFNSIVEMTNRSPGYARAYLQQTVPGSDIVDNKDGTYTAIIPGQKGAINQFTYNPK